MTANKLWIPALLVAAGVLGTVAVRARERSYAVPVHAQPRAIPSTLSSDVPAGYEVRTLTVDGICCQGCSSKLHGALMALEGVRAAAVDPLKGEASAVVRTDVASARLEAALTFDKYTAHAH